MNSAFSPEVYNPDIHTFSVAIQYPDGSIGSRPFVETLPDDELVIGGQYFKDLPKGSQLLLPATPSVSVDPSIPIIPNIMGVHENSPVLVGADFNQTIPGRVAEIIRILALARGGPVSTNELVEIVGESKGTSPRKKVYSTVRKSNEELLDFALGHSVDVGLDHRYITSNSKGSYVLLVA